MNTITNTLRIDRTRGALALLALVVGVLAAFSAAFALPGEAEAQGFYTDGYCTGCDTGGWEPEYESYNTYDTYSSYDTGFYTDGYCSGCGWEPEYETYNVYDYYDYGWEPEYESYNVYDYYSYYDYEYYDYWYDYEPYYIDYSYDYYDYGCSWDCYYDPCDYGCSPPPRPEPVCSLDASEDTIERGDDVELYWTSEHATSATLSTFGSVSTGGNRSVSPTRDTTYTLTVRGNGGTDTCSVRINVEEEEDDLWCELDVSDSRVEEGDEVTLEWDARGAVRASINQGVGRVDEDGGEEEVEVDRDTTFRLTVEDEDGDEEACTATVRVDEEDDFSSITFDGGPVNNPPTVYLSQLPYTGPEDWSPSMIASIAMLTALAGIGGYFFFLKRRTA